MLNEDSIPRLGRCSNTDAAGALLVVCLFTVSLYSGCSDSEDIKKTSAVTPQDARRNAVQSLERLGVRVDTLDDDLIECKGYSVTLYAEHFTEQGTIVNEVFSELRDVRNCVLGLHQSPITDAGLKQVSEIRHLIGINLHDTRISNNGLRHLKSLSGLRLLKLKSTRISDAGLQHLKAQTELLALYLDQTRITSEGMVHLEGLTKLRALKLDENELVDSGLVYLAPLKALRFLGLGSTDITDAGLDNILKLTQLEFLDLFATDVSGEGIGRVKKALPNCEVAF